MAQWVLSVTCIAILSVLCDVIMPDGQTKKYIKTVFGVVVMSVILQPLINFCSDIAISDIGEISSEVQIQQQYLDEAAYRQNKYKIDGLKKQLSANGYSVKDVAANNESGEVIVTLEGIKNDENQVICITQGYFPNCKIKVIWK